MGLIRIICLALSIAAISMSSTAETLPQKGTAPAFFLTRDASLSYFAQAVSRGLPQSDLLIVIDTSLQKACLISSRGPLKEFLVSTSKFGIGSKANSNCTPLGWHKVTERFGADAPIGTSFVSRQQTSRVLQPSEWRAPSPAEDLVLSRVLWLTGLERGLNSGAGVDSHARYIYLHGTNQEQLLGTPASHGCIRFSNADIIFIFSFTQGVELYCLIR